MTWRFFQLHLSIYWKALNCFWLERKMYLGLHFIISRKRKRSASVLWQKPLHQQKCQKGKVTTETTPQKSSITRRLRTDLGRSVGVTTLVIYFKHNMGNTLHNEKIENTRIFTFDFQSYRLPLKLLNLFQICALIDSTYFCNGPQLRMAGGIWRGPRVCNSVVCRYALWRQHQTTCIQRKSPARMLWRNPPPKCSLCSYPEWQRGGVGACVQTGTCTL